MGTLRLALVCALVFTFVFGVCGSLALAQDGDAPAPERSVKGWELYSWQDAETGEWHYRLVRGTNMIKTIDGITAEGQEQTLEEIVKTIRGLAEGQELFWSGVAVEVEDGEASPFAFPNRESVDAVREAAKAAGVELHLIGHDDEDVDAQPLARSMKGWELYAWEDESSGEWRYCLTIGTNRIKSVDEITERALMLDQLLNALAGIEPGQEIFWPGPAAWASSEDAPFAFPDADSRGAIEKAAIDAGLKLHLLGVSEDKADEADDDE